MEKPVGILYEHPQWFLPLFAELERRAIPFERIHAASLLFDPADLEQRYSLVVNRMSPLLPGQEVTSARCSRRCTYSPISSRRARPC